MHNLKAIFWVIAPPSVDRKSSHEKLAAGKTRFRDFLPESWAQFPDACCLMLAAWCLMLACCWLLDARKPARPIHKGFTGRRPLHLFVERRPTPPPFLDGSGMCSSIKLQAKNKNQASSIKLQASSIKPQEFRNWALTLASNSESCFFRLPTSYERTHMGLLVIMIWFISNEFHDYLIRTSQD